jgi:hypothetical protein
MAARPWYLPLALTLLLSACTAWKVDYRRARAEKAHPRGPVPVLAGKRCAGETCRCRGPRDPAENPPPAAGSKRIEIRLWALDGTVKLDSPSAGHFEASGAEEACFYVDLATNLSHDFHLDSQEGRTDGGVTPHLHIAEYGPAGPYWYDILDVTCGRADAGCDLDSAKAWGEAWRETRKRGRIEPCGSISVSGLKWTTSGGSQADKGGPLRDFETSFALDVRKYATEFPPGASQCQFKP